MIQTKTVYRKTGDTSWDNFLDPDTVPADNEVREIWKTAYSNIFGTDAKTLFPTVINTLTVISNFELHQEMSAEDSELDAVFAWLDHISNTDVSYASGIINLFELLYPGETFTQEFHVLNAPSDIWTMPRALFGDWLKNEPSITVVES
jgi:hypothetical protein